MRRCVDFRESAGEETPRLPLLLVEQECGVPYGGEAFSGMLRRFRLYACCSETQARGHQGERMMFSLPAHVAREECCGQVTNESAAGLLAKTLTGSGCLHGGL